jgi:CheY-like chemotaxis protein
MISGRPTKILLIDSNVYFAKRLADALKKEGFDVTSSTQPAFALTTLEYDAPSAVVCATNMREMGALEIAKIIHADPKNSNLPIIALGDGSQRALMEAFQAGCEDYIDRQRPPAVIATHIRNIVISKAEGFQPTQMLAQADTSLSGSLTHHDLPGVLQMLGHAHQTGALHINAGATDALLFFDAGNISHAECGNLFGDEAVIHIIKSCVEGGQGVYKFVYGATSNQHTVLRNATDLMLDAMREYDESTRDSSDAGLRNTADEDAALAALDSDFASESSAARPASADSQRDPFHGSPLSENSSTGPNLQSSLPTAEALEGGGSTLPCEGSPFDQSEFSSAASPSIGGVQAVPLSNITNRILDDLRSRPDNPVDRALADLLSSAKAADASHAAPEDRASNETPLDTAQGDQLDAREELAPSEPARSAQNNPEASATADHARHEFDQQADQGPAEHHIADKELP